VLRGAYAPLFSFPPFQRGIKGDLKSLSVSLSQREKPGPLRSSRGRGAQGDGVAGKNYRIGIE